MNNTRLIAFNALLKIEKNKAYSNLTLDSFLTKSKLDSRDRAFVSALFYGVIEKKITLDYNLTQHLNKGLKKLKPEVLIILRLGAYQLLFMDKIPSSAAINESVKLSKKCGCSFASGLINAVLRKIDSTGLVLPNEDDFTEFLSVKYSCNPWLSEKWVVEYGKEDAEKLLACSLEAPDVFLRVNTTKITTDDLMKILSEEGILCEKTDLENSLKINLKGNDIESLPSYQMGYYHVQDLASQYCAKALNGQEGDTIFDLCSAPGGKAYTTAELMNNRGKVLCFDKYDARVKLITDGAARLGLSIIEGAVSDAEIYRDDLGFADRVLCDVPCSGLGIIRRKPEIKYKSREELEGLPVIQYNILSNGARYVRPGGFIVYSTCTLSRDENEDVCQRFLNENKNFTAVKPLVDISDDYFVTLMPHKNSCDGFFIACFQRNE